MEIRKGDIYYAKLKGEGSVQKGERPVIISSSDINNKYAPTVQVIPLTSSTSKKKLPVHVQIRKQQGITEDSIALAEQEQTINKKDLLGKVGTCTNEVMLQIDNAIRIQRDMKEPVSLPYMRLLAKTVVMLDNLMQKIKQLSMEDIAYYNSTLQELKLYCDSFSLDYKIILRSTKSEYGRTEAQCTNQS